LAQPIKIIKNNIKMHNNKIDNTKITHSFVEHRLASCFPNIISHTNTEYETIEYNRYTKNKIIK